MKSITRYALCAFVIAIALFITGEMQAYIAETAISETGAYFDFWEEFRSDSCEELSPEVYEQLYDKYNVSAFCLSRNENELLAINTIYCCGDAQNVLRNKLKGKTDIKSFIFEDTEYVFKDISQLSNPYPTNFYLIGESKNIEEAKRYLSGNIGSFSAYLPEDNTADMWMLCVFVVTFIIVMVFTFSDVAMQEKDYIIRATLGHSRLKMSLAYSLKDAVIFALIISAVYFFWSFVTSIKYCIFQVICLYVAITAVCTLVWLSLILSKPTKVLKGKNNNAKLLTTYKLVKIVVTCLNITVISMLVTACISAEKYLESKDFFKEHKDYYYINYSSEGGIDSIFLSDGTVNEQGFYIMYDVLDDYYDRCKPIMLKPNMLQTNSNEDKEAFYIVANSLSIDYLKDRIAGLDELKIEKEVLLIMPKDSLISENVMLEHIYINYYDEENLSIDDITDKVQIYTPPKSYSVIGEDSGAISGYELYKDAPVIYISADENEDGYDHFKLRFPSYYLRLDDSLVQEITNKYRFEKFEYTNIWDIYSHGARLHFITIAFFGVFAVMLIVVEIIVIASSVSLDFSVNCKEYCILKVLGYSFLSRYIDLILSTVITNAVCFALCAFVMKQLDASVIIAAAVCVIMLLIELILVVFKAAKAERQSIVKILKGGAL